MTERRRLDHDAFRDPSRDHGILPFWFLNGELDPDEMRYQLGELRAKGMQGVVLHGRFGLEMPYVGETYLDRIALADRFQIELLEDVENLRDVHPAGTRRRKTDDLVAAIRRAERFAHLRFIGRKILRRHDSAMRGHPVAHCVG